MPIQASTKELYRMFLDSDFWRDLSSRKRELVGRCEACGETRRLQAHHKRYPNNWFDTTLDDLTVLCRFCHERKHGKHIKPESKKKHKVMYGFKLPLSNDDFERVKRMRDYGIPVEKKMAIEILKASRYYAWKGNKKQRRAQRTKSPVCWPTESKPYYMRFGEKKKWKNVGNSSN